MNKTIHILGFAGSLRKNSYNKMALRTAAESAGDNVEIEIFDLEGIPLYNEDVKQKGFPQTVHEFREKIREADALLIASPEYNHSFTGVLKNAIDWASRPPDQPLNDKPVAVIGATTSMWGTVRGLNHLRQVLVTANMQMLNKPEVLIAQAQNKFDENGNLKDESTRKFLAEIVEKLVEWTRRLEGANVPGNRN